MEEAQEAITVQSATYQLVRLYASRRAFAEWSAASGTVLSRSAFDLLGHIGERGSVTLGDLGRLAHMDPSAVSRQVRGLEEMALVERSEDPGDRRVSLISLTVKGKEIHSRIAEVGARHLSDVLHSWSKKDRSDLARLLPKLVADLRSHRYLDPDLTEMGGV
ncbi:MAG: MarR family transcriptional regulator [Actinobacteria bacterium]|jgi:DNA-binding MarR family transcriptional regulator|nr:MarR family transcriptional regulator [Actinomycetota bacterium]MCL5444510.1 MarR family transcriptional regulator [Actinomycetota bacterium]